MTGLAPPSAARRGRPPSTQRLAPLPPENNTGDFDDLINEPETAPVHTEMRAPMREEDPKARAARRALEIKDHLGGTEAPEAFWEFDLPEGMVPEGWIYEWKTFEVLGATDPAREVELAQAGWDAVPLSRHPEMMPRGSTAKTIDRKGQRLMEIPKEIYDARKLAEAREARLQVRQKEEALNGTPDGHLDRSAAKIAKGYEPIPIPEN